jgi:prephenate dehydrogenase
MPDRIQITIVGLGLIGTSFGLALKRHKRNDLFILGHDKEPTAVAAALAEM